MLMRVHSVDGGNAAKFMIMAAIWKGNGRAGYPADLMIMSVINRSKSKISVGMLHTRLCGFGRTSITMAVPVIKRCMTAEFMRMNRPSIP